MPESVGFGLLKCSDSQDMKIRPGKSECISIEAREKAFFALDQGLVSGHCRHTTKGWFLR